jgi:tetratricopeptide (TPR) repeat protein
MEQQIKSNISDIYCFSDRGYEFTYNSKKYILTVIPLGGDLNILLSEKDYSKTYINKISFAELTKHKLFKISETISEVVDCIDLCFNNKSIRVGLEGGVFTFTFYGMFGPKQVSATITLQKDFEYSKALVLSSKPKVKVSKSSNGLSIRKETVVSRIIGIETSSDVNSIFVDRGMKLYETGKYNEALIIFKHLASKSVKDFESLYYQGLCNFKLKRHLEALSAFLKLEGIEPNYQETVNYISECRELLKDKQYYYVEKGNTLSLNLKCREAIDMYNKAIEIEPSFAIPYINKGIILFNQKLFKESIECYDKLIELEPDNAIGYNNRGNCYSALKDYNKAIENYDKAIELNPKYVEAYNNKGNIMDNLGRYDEAIKYYEIAFELEPSYGVALNNKAVVLKHLNRYEEAIECYTKATDIDPKLAIAYSNKGLLLHILHRDKESRKCHNKAIKMAITSESNWGK